MQELTIFYNGEPIGTLTGRQDGLYWKFICKIEKKTERPLRIYVLQMFNAEYLGIPDADGSFTAKISARHFSAAPDGATASELPRGEWYPWHGTLDGVPVAACLLRRTDDGFTVAFPPEEALQFPQWLDGMTPLSAFGKQWASLAIDHDGHLPSKEIEHGGKENETTDIDSAARGVPDDAPAGDGLGQDGREADRADL